MHITSFGWLPFSFEGSFQKPSTLPYRILTKPSPNGLGALPTCTGYGNLPLAMLASEFSFFPLLYFAFIREMDGRYAKGIFP